MPKISLRYQRVSDAKRFYEILTNPSFIFFRVAPKSLETEREFLRQNKARRQKHEQYNYAILYGGKLVGGCGLRIDQHRKFKGEIGYFIDQPYWGRGIASQAVRLLEKIGFKQMKLKRIEIVMDIKNKASEKVAKKCGYKKEGLMKKAIPNRGQLRDAYLYAKVIK